MSKVAISKVDMIVGVALPVVYRPPEFDRINFLNTHRELPHDYVIPAERVYNVVVQGSQMGAISS